MEFLIYTEDDIPITIWYESNMQRSSYTDSVSKDFETYSCKEISEEDAAVLTPVFTTNNYKPGQEPGAYE